eukprot:7360252-Prorocentrum_lima.AAC.1
MGCTSQEQVRRVKGDPQENRYHTKPGTTEGPRGTFGVQIVRLQSDNGGELINEPLIEGWQKRG